MVVRDSRPLEGRAALVTSSSRNLGAEIARSLAAAGAHVAVQYHAARAAAEALVDELTSLSGPGHVAVPGDTGTPQGVEEIVEQATANLGWIDVLVNNSGPFDMTPFAELEVDTWDDIFGRNVTAAFAGARAVAPGMRDRGWGRVINVSAGSAFVRNHGVYGLAKDAVIALTEELALELAPEITVNGVAPGQIEESAADIHEVDPTFVARAVAHTPTGRLVTRRQVGELVVATCGPPFDAMTGVTIPVDGGWRLNRF